MYCIGKLARMCKQKFESWIVKIWRMLVTETVLIKSKWLTLSFRKAGGWRPNLPSQLTHKPPSPFSSNSFRNGTFMRWCWSSWLVEFYYRPWITWFATPSRPGLPLIPDVTLSASAPTKQIQTGEEYIIQWSNLGWIALINDISFRSFIRVVYYFLLLRQSQSQRWLQRRGCEHY